MQQLLWVRGKCFIYTIIAYSGPLWQREETCKDGPRVLYLRLVQLLERMLGGVILVEIG